jgi:hypothetical protein
LVFTLTDVPLCYLLFTILLFFL